LGSLWQAIADANATGGADEIHFDILGSGVHTIHQAAEFPPITEAVVIDGYSQSGASVNKLAVGDNAVLQIEVDCSDYPFQNLFNFVGGGSSRVSGLVINRFPGQSQTFRISGGSFFNTITGNFIGTDPTGMEFEGGPGTVIQLN